MNAGRDVERLIAGWLVEEAVAGAPVRVLDSIRLSIDRVPQRRFIAAGRHSVSLSMTRLAAIAAVFIAALLGAGAFGRLTAPVAAPNPSSNPGPTSPAPGQSAAGVSLDSYRVARNEICARYRAQLDPLKPSFAHLYDAGLTDDERSVFANVLLGYANGSEQMESELATLQAPPEIAAQHAEMVANLKEVNRLIRDVLAKIANKDLEGARASDLATDPYSRATETFERDNDLQPCP